MNYVNSKPIIIATAIAYVLVASLVIASATGSIHKWEKEAGYPFGYMCHSIFTFYENTCDLRKRR